MTRGQEEEVLHKTNSNMPTLTIVYIENFAVRPRRSQNSTNLWRHTSVKTHEGKAVMETNSC